MRHSPSEKECAEYRKIVLNNLLCESSHCLFFLDWNFIYINISSAHSKTATWSHWDLMKCMIACKAYCKLSVLLDMIVMCLHLATSGFSYIASHFHTSIYSFLCVHSSKTISGPCTSVRVLTHHSAASCHYFHWANPYRTLTLLQKVTGHPIKLNLCTFEPYFIVFETNFNKTFHSLWFYTLSFKAHLPLFSALLNWNVTSWMPDQEVWKGQLWCWK